MTPKEFATQIKAHSRWLDRFFGSRLRGCGFCGDRATEKDDLIQKTVIDVEAACRRGKLQQYDFSVLLAERAKSIWRNYLNPPKKRQPTRPLDQLPESRHPTAPFNVLEYRDELVRALDQTDPELQQVYKLRSAGYPLKDIADMIGTTEGALKMRIHRDRQQRPPRS